jgi:hypothetical protein
MPDGLEPPLPVDQLRLLIDVLAAEPGLAPVWNWQRTGYLMAGAASRPSGPDHIPWPLSRETGRGWSPSRH